MAVRATLVVDTSAWIEFFAHGDERLARALDRVEVFVHPWVLYELELGSGLPTLERDRLVRLPRIAVVSDEAAWRLGHVLRGTGVGWVDVHLLAATQAAGFALVTRDEPLRRAARRAGVPIR